MDDFKLLEEIIDRNSLRSLCDMLGITCREKADHIRTNWQDEALANRWAKAASECIKLQYRLPAGL